MLECAVTWSCCSPPYHPCHPTWQDELDAAQSRLKRVKREVESRTQMLRKQLLRWRQLGFVRNKWQTMAAAYRERRGARKGRRVATTTATKALRSPNDKNLWDQEEVDPDDVFDLSLGRLKVRRVAWDAVLELTAESLIYYLSACDYF